MYRYLIRSARPPATRQRLGKKTSKELEEVKIDNQALKLEKEITTHNFNRFRTSYKDYLSLREANQKYTNELANLSTKLTNVDRKINLMEELSTEEVSLIKERDRLKILLADNTKAREECYTHMKELDKEIDNKLIKSSFISSDFDFKKFIGSLNQEELLALSGLLLNSLILNYTISIILILYGEYLIKRFNLEDRFPRLAKFIKLRRTLQNYYLKICFVWIFIGILPQIFIYISILYPKLIELFIS